MLACRIKIASMKTPLIILSSTFYLPRNVQWSAIVVILAVLVLTTASRAEPGENLLPNPGFEDGLSGWVGDQKNPPNFTVDSEIVHEGMNSLKIVNPDDSGTTVRFVRSKHIEVDAQSAYRLSFYFRSQDIEQDAFHVRVLQFPASGEASNYWRDPNGSGEKLFQMSGSTEKWEKKEIKIDNLNPDTIKIVIYFLFKGGGSVHIDDVCLEPLASPNAADGSH
ncbi:hypothetical protein BH09VER1_BH09VER1_55290 [soil metagenome]